VGTAATEATSGDEEDFEEEENESSSRRRQKPQIPLILQESRRRQLVEEEEQEQYDGEDDDNFFTSSQNLKQRQQHDNEEPHEQHHHTENQLYGQLHRYWLQECHCPELIRYDDNIVSTLLKGFEEMQEDIDNLSESSSPTDLLMCSLTQQDLDRAKFVLSDWLTQRLNKIEKFALFILRSAEEKEKLSETEYEYCKAYEMLVLDHLEKTVTDHIPEAWRRLDLPNMIDKPDYDGYHFWFVKQTILDKEGNDLKFGSCVVAKYIDMKDSMLQNKVEILL
jgi:GINS complex subunit 4